MVAGVAGLSRGPFHDMAGGAEIVQAAHHRFLGIRRDENVERPIGGPRDDCRRQGRVAAARDGQAAGTEPLGQRQARLLQDPQIDHHAHQMTGLVRTADVAGFVLDPDPGLVRRACGGRQAVDRPERRDPEPGAVDAGDRPIQVVDEGAEIGVRETVGQGKVMRQGQLPVAQEGVLGGKVVDGCRKFRAVQVADQDMVDAVAFFCSRTGKGKRRRRIDAAATARTDDPDPIHG